MNVGRFVTLLLALAALSGSMLYYSLKSEPALKNGTNCFSTTTVLPLVNTNTGLGMTATIAECD
tara:strand:- start:904 stop:1095 length:192 start_codon:yes stop_codon:yes gene_type:complete